jgi:hypothetical protein
VGAQSPRIRLARVQSGQLNGRNPRSKGQYDLEAAYSRVEYRLDVGPDETLVRFDDLFLGVLISVVYFV